jgi:hypothetical protein
MGSEAEEMINSLLKLFERKTEYYVEAYRDVGYRNVIRRSSIFGYSYRYLYYWPGIESFLEVYEETYTVDKWSTYTTIKDAEAVLHKYIKSKTPKFDTIVSEYDPQTDTFKRKV